MAYEFYYIYDKKLHYEFNCSTLLPFFLHIFSMHCIINSYKKIINLIFSHCYFNNCQNSCEWKDI